LLSVTCDNASANTTMLEDLSLHLRNFLGKKMHIRCFAHTINLTAKGVLRPFEAGKRVEEDVPRDDRAREELIAEIDDLVERGGVDNDDDEGFVDVLNELTAAERNDTAGIDPLTWS
ncbi:hypothetical protein EV360DRAFT_47885, partial [Lentinula raphanica]